MALMESWKTFAIAKIKFALFKCVTERRLHSIGKLGVCLDTSGPGGVHLLNGLYDTKPDGEPVLAITGHHYHDLINTHSQQNVDLDKVFMDVIVYNTRVMGATHVENVATLACRAALSYRGVAHIGNSAAVDHRER